MGMLLSRHYTDNKKTYGAAVKAAPSPSNEVKEEKKNAEDPRKGITVEDIKAMNGTKIRKFAKDNGVENPEDLTVNELKAILCEKFS